MSIYLPTVELTSEIQIALSAGTLNFQRGQWVSLNGVKGRFLGVTRYGEVRILFRFIKESFNSFNLRFKKSLFHKVSKRVNAQAQQLNFNYQEFLFQEKNPLEMVMRATHRYLFRNKRTRKLQMMNEFEAHHHRTMNIHYWNRHGSVQVFRNYPRGFHA